MKNFIIALFLFLPFLAMGQKNVLSNQFESFASKGAILNGKKFDKKTFLVSVDWLECVLIVDGVHSDFVIYGKGTDKQTGETLTYCIQNNGLKFVLVSDTEGVRGLSSNRVCYDVEIGDIWAEMQNSK